MLSNNVEIERLILLNMANHITLAHRSQHAPIGRKGDGIRPTGFEVQPLTSKILHPLLSQDWSQYGTSQSEPLIPQTNNVSEWAIGRMKIEAHTVRGYKSPGMQVGLLLSGCSIL